MEVSVIICTYNRCKQLKNVLKDLSEQVATEGFEWEIIVVDNNSTDDTSEVIKEFIEVSDIPDIYVKEEKQGLSHARNRGIINSKGKYVAFTDDDVLVDRNWVKALYEAFQKYKCDCVGGRIHLKPVRELPRWLKKELLGFLAYLDYGDKPFQISNHFIYGTNMAFTRGVLNKVGYFNTELGRTGHTPLGGEETDLIKKILEIGGRVYYQPDAKVHHIVEEYKLSKRYFRNLHYYEGICNGKSYNGVIKKHIYGIPFFIFPQFLRSIMKYLKNPTLRMQMNIWWFLGFMRGRMIRYKARKS